MDLVPNEWTQEGRITPHTCKIRTTCVGNGILTNHITSSAVLTSAAPSPADAPSRPSPMEKPADGQPLRCPRCDSSNTKFCYYNNYSLSQPRHFCKACKRYWTRGGTLRNVPVGGGCRKNKRVRKSSLITSAPSNISPPAPPLSFFPSSTSMATPSTDLGFLFYNLSNSGNDMGFTTLQAPYNLSLGFSSEDGYLPSLNQIPPSTPHQGYGLNQISSSFASCLLSSDEAVENRGILGFSGINQLEGSSQIFKEVKPTMGRSEWEITSSENPVDFPLLWNNSASNALGGSLWTDSSNCGFPITPLL